MRSLLINPHYYSASVLAKLSAAWATGVWSFVVLVRDDAMNFARFPLYANMTAYIDARIWAAVAMLCAVLAMYRLLTHAEPRWYGSLVYGWFMCFWLYIAFEMLTTASIIMPVLSGAVTAVAGLATYAFIVNPKRAP